VLFSGLHYTVTVLLEYETGDVRFEITNVYDSSEESTNLGFIFEL
jgi:hypothetical protein